MNRWDLVQELFETTVGLEPHERERYLREHTDGDLALMRDVEALAAADAQALDAFDRGATQLLLELRNDRSTEQAPEALVGATFDAYRVDAHLSSGGMAHVYRATRTSAGTERRVALKVLRAGLDTEAFLQRFQRERRTLATLEHEHIVAFLDAGALPDGRPYLVMEYVEGRRLSEWGAQASRTERLRLFLSILAAVQYAHHSLVVHRDLKPSNILVTDKGTPKLLDFGVAAVLEEDDDPRTPLTPAYASPEQLRGAPVTTATDVYSLGVVLHELLCGALPAEGVVPDLPADLVAVLARACSVDPSARYASADALADDLRRWLAHEPVHARANTWGHRLSLGLRRHRYAAALTAAVLVALVAGWVGSDLARRRAETEASAGWGAHAQARGAARVFKDWLTTSVAQDPGLFADATEHLEASLRQGLERYPETETLVRMTLAELYLGRGDRERAAPHAERAWELAQGTRGVGRGDRERAALLHAQTGSPAPDR